MKILLAEDDQNFGDVLKSFLEMNEYEVDLRQDGEQALVAYTKNVYDLCILDVMMPKMDGFVLAKNIRDIDEDMPIIFLTARDLESDILEGFRIGADDYMTKPFSADELLYRVKAVVKRSKSKNSTTAKEFDIGKYHYNYPLRLLVFDGKEEEKLSPKEAELLHMFCQTKNEVLPRSEALKKIWGEDNYFTARSMDVFIAKLRKYLSKDKNIEIINIHGNGFRLMEHQNIDQ